MSKELALLTNATRMLAEIKTPSDARALVDLAEAARVYAKKIGLGWRAQNQAAEIKVRAERAGGELLSRMEKHPGRRPSGSKAQPQKLADIGIEKTQSSRWQAIASLTESTFEGYIAAMLGSTSAEELTEAGLLRLALQRPPRTPLGETPELPSGMYSTIVADPPWDVLTGPEWGSNGPARGLTYPTMSIEQIAALPVAERAAPDAHLYLWTINAYLEKSFSVARAWGFEPSTVLTWCKPKHGLGLGGAYVLTSEHVLFCRRGELAASTRVDTNWFQWPRRAHSVKPIEFYTMVESVSPGPYLEMFAREPREGWDVWGNEVTDGVAS